MAFPSADIIEKDETLSTNDDARELALAGAPQGTAVLARRQSQGRGRAGRTFASPEGGLYLSVVLRPQRPPASWALLPLLGGAVVASVLRMEHGVDARVKWPNDILLGSEKLGGILVETRWGAEAFAIVGIGLNIGAVPEGVEGATALLRHGAAPDARALGLALRDALVERVARWEREGDAPLLSEIRRACVTLGRDVVWEEKVGRAVDITSDGALVVEADDGTRARIVAGDVRLRLR